MALFESYERRIDKINGVLAQYGIGSVEECREICKAKGFDPYEIVKGIQPICFENACWAYTVGAAIAIKSGVKTAAEAAKMIGVGLQSFCIDGSVAEDRKVGLGHGNLGAMLLSDDSKCFAFLAGHESFAAAEGAIGIVKNANKARKEPLRVILNGLGKDAAQIISRINGFTYVQTQFDYYTSELKIVREIRYSEGERANVRCYGADDVREGVLSGIECDRLDDENILDVGLHDDRNDDRIHGVAPFDRIGRFGLGSRFELQIGPGSLLLREVDTVAIGILRGSLRIVHVVLAAGKDKKCQQER